MSSFSLKEQLKIGVSLDKQGLLGRLSYPQRQRFYEARYAPGSAGSRSLLSTLAAMFRRRPPTPDVQPLGDLLSSHRDGQAVDLICRNGVLRLEVLAADLIRLRLCPVPFPLPFSYALDPAAEWPPVPFEVKAAIPGTSGTITIRTAKLTCLVDCSPCRLTIFDAQDRPLCEPVPVSASPGPTGHGPGDRGAGGDEPGWQGLGFQALGAFWTHRLAPDEAIYGLGENTFDLNLRGRALEMWNTDPETYGPGDDPINLCIPMLVGLREGRAYGLFFDNPGRARFDLGQAQPDQLRYQAATGELCLYFFGGGTIPAVLERYTQLTGRMPMPARWMLGYHQSRWSYHPENQVRELAAQFRRREIPCDSIHLDIHYMDGYRIFTWDGERFPDPPRLAADLRQQGFRLISIIDPGVKVDPGYHVHDEGLAADAFCKLPDGALFQGPVWPGECYFPDFTDPQVRAWWGDLYRPLLETGLAGFWNDMNEPAIFGGEMPNCLPHHYEGHGATHEQIHNVYGLQMSRASAEGLCRLRPDERVPLISRAGYAGLQRHALVWTADNHSTWAQLRLGISMCMNLGLSGVAFCGPDVGGFASDCDGELLARWTQVGALTPFFRNHSALGTQQQEPWAFGQPYESICRRWIEFRYELLPYLYTLAWQATQTGLPMMRPLALAYPHDARTYSLDDQFLLGDDLLAAPVGHPGQTSRQVYLPDGPWYDFWTGERHSGEITAAAPLERLPLYVRAGAVLPMGPVMQHTGQWPPDALHLQIYPGDGESWLYEDDGHSMAYRSGDFQITHFVCRTSGDGALTVRRQVEGPFLPGYERFEVQIHGLPAPPKQALADGQPLEVVYDDQTRMARLSAGPWAELRIL